MFSYFKANDPYRMIGVFIVLIIIRTIILSIGMPSIYPELQWLLIGERLAGDATVMYRDLYDTTGPMSAFVYKWLFILFGKTRTPYIVFSIVLVIFQAGIFNNVMLSNKAYNQNTYVPALVYILFMNLFFDFLTLSPVLMALTFILMAIHNLFQRMDNTTRDELFVFTGIYLGIATLFFLPSFMFFIVTLVSIVSFTGSILRRIMLLIYGFVIVLLMAAAYFFWFSNYQNFVDLFIYSAFYLNPTTYFEPLQLFILMGISIVIYVLSFFKMVSIGRYINYQQKIQQVMLLFSVSGIAVWFLSNDRSTYQWIYFIPSIAFFTAHYLLLIRNWMMAELTFLIIVIAVSINCLFPLYGWFHADQLVSYKNLSIVESKYKTLTEGKKILVLGNELQHYQNASLATPYLNWSLSKESLTQLQYFETSSEVFMNFQKDMPQVIIDLEHVTPALFGRMPTIAARYTKHSIYPEVLILKD